MEKDFYKMLDEYVNYGEKKEKKEERTVIVKYSLGEESKARIEHGGREDNKRKGEDGISTLIAGARMMAEASGVETDHFVAAVVGHAVKKIVSMGFGNMLEELLRDD